MKKQKQNRFLLLLLVMISSISFAQRNQLEVNPDFGDGSVYYKLGPTGEYNYIASSAQAVSNLNCNVNGITINTTGSSTGAYLFPNNNNELLCDDIVDPASLPNTIQSWSSSSPNGFVTYTFSQPVSSVRISYSAVNSDDVATMSINAPGMQLSDPCGLSISGNVISCTFPAPNGNPFVVSYGDVALTVSSSTPFTEITLQNTGGNSGWVSGNPCNFIIYNEIVYSPKYEYTFCYDDVIQFSPSLFLVSQNGNGLPVTINGIQANQNNATINVVNSNAMANLNLDGTLTYLPSTQPHDGVIEFYICDTSGTSCSELITYNVTIGKVLNTGSFVTYYNQFGELSGQSFNVYSDNQNNLCYNIPATTNNVNLTIINSSPEFTFDTNGNLTYIGGLLQPFQTYSIEYKLCTTNYINTFCETNIIYIYIIGNLNRTQINDDKISLTIYPNPSNKGVFNIDFGNIIEKISLDIYNILGQEVYSENIKNATNKTLNLEHLSKGTYVLKINDGNEIVTKNLVIQ